MRPIINSDGLFWLLLMTCQTLMPMDKKSDLKFGILCSLFLIPILYLFWSKRGEFLKPCQGVIKSTRGRSPVCSVYLSGDNLRSVPQFKVTILIIEIRTQCYSDDGYFVRLLMNGWKLEGHVFGLRLKNFICLIVQWETNVELFRS